MSFGKRCTKFFSWAVFSYIAYKAYRYITGMVNIIKELPVYLKNVLGETPSMNVTAIFNRLKVTLTFSAETIEKHPDIAKLAEEYITRYYPIFRQDHVEVIIIQKYKKEEPVEEEVIEDIPEKLEPEKD